jgi:hypothetical protein
VERRKGKNVETFIAASALYQTLFNKKTIGYRDENSTSILVDTYKDKFIWDNDGLSHDRRSNIIASFDIIFLIGWKQHSS